MDSSSYNKLLRSVTFRSEPSSIPKPVQKSKTISLEKSISKPNIFVLPEMFYVNLTETKKKPRKQTLKNRLTVLSEFGIIPGKGHTIKPKIKKRTVVESSIKLSELMGKKNARMIFKSFDLESMVHSAKSENIDDEKIKKILGIAKDNRSLTYSSAETHRHLSPQIRRIMTANGPRDPYKRSKELEEIEKIFRSCDELKSDNKKLYNLLK